jgi:hypothetical protein
VTCCAWLIVTLQLPPPAHAPPQPLKLEPLAGVAVSVTALPLAKLAEQVLPQLIPAGLELTVPLPLLLTLSVKLWPAGAAGLGWPPEPPPQAASQPQASHTKALRRQSAGAWI